MLGLPSCWVSLDFLRVTACPSPFLSPIFEETEGFGLCSVFNVLSEPANVSSSSNRHSVASSSVPQARGKPRTHLGHTGGSSGLIDPVLPVLNSPLGSTGANNAHTPVPARVRGCHQRDTASGCGDHCETEEKETDAQKCPCCVTGREWPVAGFGLCLWRAFGTTASSVCSAIVGG